MTDEQMLAILKDSIMLIESKLDNRINQLWVKMQSLERKIDYLYLQQEREPK